MLKLLKLKMNKKSAIAFTSLVILLGVFFLIPPVSAETTWPTTVIGGILGTIIGAVGLILILIIKALVYVSSYSHFIDSGAVSYGWVMVRDLCNMFFVVILLVIAFGTILNIESYNYKKWLPKLILMAILINFSKTICGILIDVAQIVMLTFVNSFKTIGGANMSSILGIDQILQMDKASEDPGFWTVIGAYMLGLIYIIVATIVIITMLVMLIMRIVMIWIYVVLSPLAYLLAAFPGGQSYASKWWSEFTKNLIVGPVLAFFIWLSLAALNADQIRDAQNAAELNALDQDATAEYSGGLGSETGDTGEGDEATAVIGTQASSPSALIKFIISIGMLIGGLKIAQEVGGAAGSIAGKGMNAVSKAGKMGMAGVAAATGYTYAKNVAGNYQKMRQSKKAERYQLGAEKLAGAVGSAKQKVGQGINAVSGKVKQGANYVTKLDTWGKQAAKLSEESRNQRVRATEIQSNFNKKEGVVSVDGQDFSYNKESKEWESRTETEEYTKADGTTGTRAKKITEDELKGKVNQESTRLHSEADENSKKAEAKAKAQRRADKMIKAGLIAGGVTVGALTGGVGAEMIAGMAMAGAAASGPRTTTRALSKAGKQDLSFASETRTKQLKAAQEEIKDDSDKEILTKMDDPTLDKFERAAAAMEAMSRGILSSSQAQSKKESIKRDIGGANKDGSFKDKKVGEYFESVAEKKNLSATSVFEDLRSGDVEKKAEAQRKISDGMESGKYKLEDMDSDAIKSVGGMIASSMKTGDFASQVSSMKDGNKKNEIIETLKQEAYKDTSGIENETDRDNAENMKVEILKKIARVDGIDKIDPVVNGEDQVEKDKKIKEVKEKIVADFNIDELTDKFSKGSKNEQEVIIKIMRDSGKGVEVFKKANLKSSSIAAKDLRAKLGVNESVASGSGRRAPEGYGMSSGGIITPL